ncbi:MAG TPA: glutamine amidotransferase [Pseudonocardiaceae bacterium]|jgi:hypothetical protein|nr:glutamine amidotransferase [Pseudonocardiaceae bacterium]
MTGESTVRIGLVLPDVLGTYGDNGNAVVLLRRLQWRDMRATVVPITIDRAVPESLDVYLLGGGEDAAQLMAARHLAAQPGLRRAAMRGAPMLAVCAGLQLFGHEFAAADGSTERGLGLLDLVSTAGSSRAVGEIVSQPASRMLVEPLTGFENHQGRTALGADAQPLAHVVRGTGNGDHTDGAVYGRIVATYLHGPVLARNPELADLLLTCVTGGPLTPLDIPALRTLRHDRLAASTRRHRSPRSAGRTRRETGQT